LLFAALGFAIAGCASKDDVSLADVEKQAFADLRGEIREVIVDPSRESEAIAIVDWLVADFDNLREKISIRRKRVRALNADYDTTRADFETFFDQIDKEIRLHKRQVSEMQRALFAVTTSDERSTISKAHTKAMDAAIKAIQAI
jgi:hypothetical protein